MPSEKELLKILEKESVDSGSWAQEDPKAAEDALYLAESRMRGAAIPQIDGTIRSFHVTDNPAPVVEILEGKADFYERKGDLCGGLYVSSEPNFWEGRSERKWDFMQQLPPESMRTLIDAIAQKIDGFRESGYITPSEYEVAVRDLDQARKGYWQVLSIVANQPYNVNIPDLAKRLGIAKPFEPFHVPVDFVGRYLEFNTKAAIDAYMELLRKKFKTTEGLTRTDLCDLLRDYGFDGVFTKAGFGTNPELVIWNKGKILTFGDWTRETGATLGAALRQPIWFVDPFGESRFEGVVSPDRTRAMILDKLLKQSFDLMSRNDVLELRQILEAIGAGDPDQALWRFESRLLYGAPQITDSNHVKHFRGLRPQDLDQLEKLVEKVLEVMV